MFISDMKKQLELSDLQKAYPRLQSLSSKIPLPATWTGSQVPQLQLAVNLVGTQSMWNLFANCEVWYSRREQLCSLFLAWFFACSMFVLSFLCTHPSTLTESSKKSKVLCDSILVCETNNSNTKTWYWNQNWGYQRRKGLGDLQNGWRGPSLQWWMVTWFGVVIICNAYGYQVFNTM